MNKQKRLTIVGLGPGNLDALTLGAQRAMEDAETLVLRTGRHAVAAWLVGRRVLFHTLDSLYADSEDFDVLNERTVQTLLEWLQSTRKLCYAVSDPAQDVTVRMLLAELPPDVSVTVLPCVSTSEYVRAGAIPFGHGQGPYRSAAAIDAPQLEHDPDLPLCVTEIDSRILASQLKLWLLERYPAQTKVLFAAPGEHEACLLTPIALEELDRQPTYSHTVALWVAALDYRQRERFGFTDLVRILRVLRAPDGCAWDREQTHESLCQHLIEEAYEAVDAVRGGDPDDLADELGDVLLQIVFHAQIAAEHRTFTIDEVTTDICRKMIARHAHIFGDAHCETADDVQRNWDKIKQQERGQATQAEVLASVPKYLPALMRAAKVQKKAAHVGFDWDKPQDALDKVLEEARELRAELDAGADPQEEGGDLLFAAVNALRLAGVQPELALGEATEKFVARFTRMEAMISQDGGRLEGMDLAQMDVYWDRVKREQQKK